VATIEKRSGARGISYRVRVRVNGQERTGTFARRTDAREWAHDTESALKRGRHIPTSSERRRTIADAIDRYINAVPLKARNRSSRNTIQQLKWWRTRIGELPMSNCTTAVLAEVRDELASQQLHSTGSHRSPASVNRYLAALSHCLTVASKEWQWIERNPMRNVARLEEPRGRVRFLDSSERLALLAACDRSPDPDLRTVVLLALSTGARKGEILSLEWASVDVEHQRIVLQDSKNGDRRVLTLAGPALKAMEARAAARRTDTPLVFPGRIPARPKSIEKVWSYPDKVNT
jgi:integrase